MSMITISDNSSQRFVRFLALCHSFPVLRFAPPSALSPTGIDFLALDAWAMEEDADGREGILPTVQFVLHVWSCGHPWRVGSFNLARAVQAWDTEQLRAWMNWAADPWLA